MLEFPGGPSVIPRVFMGRDRSVTDTEGNVITEAEGQRDWEVLYCWF